MIPTMEIAGEPSDVEAKAGRRTQKRRAAAGGPAVASGEEPEAESQCPEPSDLVEDSKTQDMPDQVEGEGAAGDGTAARPHMHTVGEPSKCDEAIVLVIFQDGRGPYGTLDRSVYYEVTRQVDTHLQAGHRLPHLDIWLDSPGGDAHAAYKLAVYLRTRFETVHVVVPDYAKSASTLLSLAGELIYMGPGAELGPLDVQDRREGEDRMHSTLDTANAMSTLFQDSLALAMSAGPMLLATTGLARDRTMEHLLEFTAAFTRPLVEKLDPEEILSASTSLLLSMNYASRLLNAVGSLAPEQADSLARSLVTDYPTHGHVIDRNEARDRLNLPIRGLESYAWGEATSSLLRLLQGKPPLVRLFGIDEIVHILEMSSDDDEGELGDHSHPHNDSLGDQDPANQDPPADCEPGEGSSSDHGSARPESADSDSQV